MNEIYRDICEKLEWSVTSDGNGNVELEKYSPAGEDFIITVGEENFVDNVKAYAASFDQEEHVEMWVKARHRTRGVPSVKELVAAAQAIDDMLRQLACALFAAELETVGA
ncbi:MAG: hypothetical protein K2O18_16475 [Oscillospiraceae bacterium]|nr:hypothetical protein [Oscillospiraceae bacterium]